MGYIIVSFVIFLASHFSIGFQCDNFDLIRYFLSENSLKVCVLLPCNKKSESINTELVLSLQLNGYWASMHPLNEETVKNIAHILAYRRVPVGIVTDLDCPLESNFLEAASNLTLFHQNWFWLMFSSSFDDAYEILKGQNINVDAEVTVAVPDSNENQYILIQK